MIAQILIPITKNTYICRYFLIEILANYLLNNLVNQPKKLNEVS